MRQFMPFSTLWIVRSATLALRASWACVMRRFSRISRTRLRVLEASIDCGSCFSIQGAPRWAECRSLGFALQVSDAQRISLAIIGVWIVMRGISRARVEAPEKAGEGL